MITCPQGQSPGGIATYECCVAGEVGSALADWVGACAFHTTPTGTTVFTLEGLDQAALFSVLVRIRDCGLTLISLRRCDWPNLQS